MGKIDQNKLDVLFSQEHWAGDTIHKLAYVRLKFDTGL
jgi:hypothetical protein